MTLVLCVATLEHLPLVLVLIPWLVLGFLAGVPLAANAAVARGHALKTMSPANPLHWLLRGGVWRVLLFGTLGIFVTGTLLVRLSGGGLGAWIGAMAGGAAALAVMLRGDRLSARLNAPVHDVAWLRRAAIWVGMATTALVSGLASALLSPGDLALSRAPVSLLVAEAFEAHRFLNGVLAWVQGAVVALDVLSPFFEALLAFIVLAMSGIAVAALTVASLMPARDWVRAVAISSDAPASPAPHIPSLLAAAIIAGTVIVGSLRVEMWLSEQDPAARPVAQLQTTAEQIGMRFYPPGTHARIIGGREALAALDEAALVEIRRFVNTGFDAMADQVDPFLDGYYSLWSEYWRIGVAVTGMLQGNAESAMEEHLANRLTAALDRETHLHAINERLAAMGVPAGYGAQEVQEMAMDGMEVIGLNPARIRLVGIFPAFPPLPELRSSGLTSTIEARLSGSVAVGALSTVVARRVVERLLQRGVLRLSARAVLATIPLVGTALAFGTDGVALKLEEHFNRADFRAEIVNSLEAQRAEVLQLLDAGIDP